ncbi:type I DNA topoisomerase, partial [Candidatus Gracilibacteria bacterium]|nr:type I DNA topoisomerase [Candidatus Gracilibacteria bacterium]
QDFQRHQDQRWKKLEINGIDIDNDFKPIYEIDPAKKKVVTELRKLAKNDPDILFATDSDREGEAISWHLAEVLKIKNTSKIKRLEFHEITQKAIKNALDKPRPLNNQLVKAQQARQVLDKLVGFKLSPVLWKTMKNYRLSAGRVQSPALRLICEREQEIIDFIPQEYWEIKGRFNSFDPNLKKANETTKLKNLETHETKSQKEDYSDIEENQLCLKATQLSGVKAKEITTQEQLQRNTVNLALTPTFVISKLESRKETISTRAPFTTSSLQQAASSRFGYSPKLTMQLAQRLYEGIDIDGSPTALITYMRTDSLNLSSESIQKARDFISQKYPQYLPKSPKYYKTKSKNSQEAHEAIRPTNPSRTPQSLLGKIDPKQQKLYSLIWERMIECQMTNEERMRVIFEATNFNQDVFTGSIVWTTNPGCKILTPEKILKKQEINFEQGEKISLTDIYYNQNFTSPPNRYSAASLVKKLEELGIGRPSTYASIISTLQDRQYVEDNKGNQMKPTTLGMRINELLVDNFIDVTSNELTAFMENELDSISRGEKEYYNVLDEFWTNFKKEVETKSNGITSTDKYTSSTTDEKCPKCQSQMDLKIGRFGEYFQCKATREHQFAKNYKEYESALQNAHQEFDSQTKGLKCQECNKALIVRVSKSSLNPYIACPEYRVGNKHTVTNVTYGDCPECQKTKEMVNLSKR